MTVGRPPEYNETYLEKAREYLDACIDEDEQVLTGLSVKGTELYRNKLRVKLASIGGLARHLRIHRDTIYDWEKKYPAFSDIIEELRAIQEEELINKGLSGDYNPTIAKVLLTKHGYREGKELSGVGGADLFKATKEEEEAANQALEDI